MAGDRRGVAAAALLFEIIAIIGIKAGGRFSDEADIQGAFGSPGEIGRLFLTDHLLAFEITSIVLLVATVGGVILGHHSRAPGDRALAPEAEPVDEPEPVGAR